MIRRIVDWYCARLRAIDIRILWPACQEQAKHLDDAMSIFVHHVFNDFAWRRLSISEIKQQLASLAGQEPPK